MVFRNPFRKRSLAELQSEADALFEARRFGDAKLAYDRVAERARGEDPRVLSVAEARVEICCDSIAQERAAYARELESAGERDLAREELSHALQTARSEALVAELQALALAVEQKPAEATATPQVAPLSDEERLMLITGSWEPPQAAELESYGEPLLEALLLLERGEAAEALTRLEAIRARAAEPSYLWLEIARARLAADQPTQATEALRTFLGRSGPDEGEAARLAAHRELARIAHNAGDVDGAVAELEAACEALGDDPRPFYELGVYLRQVARPAEALEVLQLAEGLFAEGRVEWPVRVEQGLAHASLGDDARATALLEAVLAELLEQGARDLPPAPAVALAQLHERAGNLVRAADLYRALTLGSDLENKARYHGEAARLLDALGLTDEAARMRAQAAAPHTRAGTSPVLEADR